MIGQLGRKHLSRHSEPAVDMGKTVSAHYQLSGYEHVDSLRIERLVEQLIAELVTISAQPGAGAASTLGLVCDVEHPEAGRIIVTFGLSNDGRDRGCH